MTKEEYKLIDGQKRLEIQELIKKKKYTIPKIRFPLKTCIKAIGRKYFFIFMNTWEKILISSKGSKKSFSFCIFILWLKCNIPNLNVLAMRNTVATVTKTLVKSFKKAIRLLINDFGLEDLKYLLEFGDGTRSNTEKKFTFPDGTIITFGAFENADQYAGLDHDIGHFGVFFIDEPIAKNVSEKVDYLKQKQDFIMIRQSIFRGVSSFGRVEVLNFIDEKGREHYTPYRFERQTLMAMNPWDDKHWINSEIVEKAISEREWREFVNEDIEENNKIVRIVENSIELEGEIKVQKTMIVKMTKFVNEFVDEAEKLNDRIMLRNGDPYDLTATLGFVYDGTDPTVYVYRNSIKESIGFENDKENNDYFLFTWGLDFGRSDKCVVVLKGWWEEDGVFINDTLSSFAFKNETKNNLRPLEICELVRDFVEQQLLVVKNLENIPSIFIYDEKGEICANILEDELNKAGFNTFNFYMSVKKGYPIISRQHIIKYLWELGLARINWEEDFNEIGFKEFWDMQYGQDGEQRDEKHYECDFINAYEYADEPMLLYLELPMDFMFSSNALAKYSNAL